MCEFGDNRSVITDDKMYDLEKNYDLTEAIVYATDNYQADGINQGIRSWDFYASRYREDLFKEENKVAGKTGYSDPTDVTISLSMKQIRFVSFVVTIEDTKYGACRLSELELYGTESAEQDADTSTTELPEYKELTASGGEIVRIYALDETDDVRLLDVKVEIVKNTDASALKKVSEMLDSRYYVNSLYSLSITDANGELADLGGRNVRLMLPVSSSNCLAAVVDSAGADLLGVKFSDNYLVIHALNGGTYALVTTSGVAPMPDGENEEDRDEPGDGTVNPPTGVDGSAGYIAIVALSVLLMFMLVIVKKTVKPQR